MSLVATYVRATDGKWYADPVLEGKIDGYDWFICFDDDDPPELVWERESGITNPMEIFERIGMKIANPGKTEKRGMRVFKGELKDANSMFFQLGQRLPVNLITSHDGAFDEEQGQGVYYDHNRNG